MAKRRMHLGTIGATPLPLSVLAAVRLALAVTAVLVPRTGARLFRINAEGTPAVAMGRMFGIRNAALAAGLLRLDSINAPRGFVLINIVVDLVDALALSRRASPPRGRHRRHRIGYGDRDLRHARWGGRAHGAARGQ
jgi:hypothetical protein